MRLTGSIGHSGRLESLPMMTFLFAVNVGVCIGFAVLIGVILTLSCLLIVDFVPCFLQRNSFFLFSFFGRSVTFVFVFHSA